VNEVPRDFAVRQKRRDIYPDNPCSAGPVEEYFPVQNIFLGGQHFPKKVSQIVIVQLFP